MFGGTRRFLALVILCTLTTGCTGSTPDPPRAEPPPTVADTTTTTTTTEPEPGQFDALLADPALTTEQQVEAAYLHSWDIYLHAINTWDTTHLELAFDEEELAAIHEEIDELRSSGLVVIGGVTHNFAVTVLADDFVLVIDEIGNTMKRVAPGTTSESDRAPEGQILESQLRLREGRWVVTSVAPLELP